ncbi:MAG: FAD:protein FMN transferase [Opitutaceae bacterium]
MGTQCEVHYRAENAAAGRAFVREAVDWVTAFESKYSRFRPDSLISRINAAASRDWVEIDADAERMFALADQIHVLSRGIIDVTMLPLLRLWNYKAPQPRVPSPEEIDAAVTKIGWARVRREPGRIYLPDTGMGLDLGGFGKEYAVDRVMDIARRHGIANVLIDFGHDVRVAGAPADAPCWSIGIEDFAQPGAVRTRVILNDGGVASSGDYIRYFEAGGRRFGHIVDPRTGQPVASDCRSVTVVAASCLEAGILSTTAFVLGPGEGRALIDDYFGAEGLLQCAGRQIQTRGFYRYAF